MNDDTISRAAVRLIQSAWNAYPEEWNQDYERGFEDAINAVLALPSAQPDAVTASLEELINDYGEDGFFIVDGVNYHANELLNELKTNSSVGEKFRKQITKTIVQYFMKFGG